jgi:hypothetical protein
MSIARRSPRAIRLAGAGVSFPSGLTISVFGPVDRAITLKPPTTEWPLTDPHVPREEVPSRRGGDG